MFIVSPYLSSKNIAKSWYLPHVQANSSGWDDPLSPPAGMVISAPAAMVTSPMPWRAKVAQVFYQKMGFQPSSAGNLWQSGFQH
jgi:hypothetical protein